MKVIEKVCSYEQAKKLVELGVVLKTTANWTKRSLPKKGESKYFLSSTFKGYPAPDVAELGILLGEDIKYIEVNQSNIPKIGYELFIGGLRSWHTTEAQARTEAFIWRIENGYLKVEDLRL